MNLAKRKSLEYALAPMQNQDSFCYPRILMLFAVLILQTLCSTSALAAGFTLEQVMSSPFPSNLVAASHSSRVAWIFDAKGSRNIWIADGPDFVARQVTHFSGDDGQPLASLRLTPDGRTLVYVKGSETNESGRVADPGSGIEPAKQQVWAIDADGQNQRLLGEMGCAEEGCEDVEVSPDGQFAVWSARKQLWIASIAGATGGRQLTDLRGNNVSPKWSPDGRSIAFVSDRKDHSFIAIYDIGHNDVRYLAASADRDVMPRWAPHGRSIAFIRMSGVQGKLPLIPERPNPWAIWIADPVAGTAKELWHSGAEITDSIPADMEDVAFNYTNDRIIFGSEQDGWNHLYSIAPGGGSPTLLTPGKFEVEDVALSADQKSILYSSNQDDVDRRHIWRVAVTGGVPTAVTKGDTMEWAPVEAGGQVVCLGSSATTPAMPYHVASQGRQMLAADALPHDFPSNQLVVPKQVIFKSEDGLDIHGQLFVPSGRTQPGPALIFTHGGPIRQMMLGFHYMQYYHNAYAMNQYLASQGYVVLSVNYRLGIMYGRAFREAPNSSWRGASEYKDVLAGAKYLQSLPIVDAKKVGLWGGSYGGYLTALGLARNSDIFAAGVDFHGVHDWSVFLPHGEAATAPDAKEADKLAFDSSPNASISTWKSPVLLIHGDDDRNVPFEQTVDLVQRLRENHVQFEELIFPDDIHDFLLWKDWMRAYSATTDFFGRTLKK
jgi:dipeptidyl aminopeptidase/acylaminoacyl peptidase